MFYSLAGKLVHMEPGVVAIECGGVAFKCFTSMNTQKNMPRIGETATVYTHLNVREDALDLYGFSTKSELNCYKMLTTISGVGPKAALSLLSEMTPEGVAMAAASGDSKVVALLQYLNLHLTEELTIDQLSERFYVSKYHMMRRFRRETGYSIHGYVTEKRLLLAQRLLAQGASPSEVGAQVGYQDYSTFSRAYKKQFGRGPSADVVRESTICMELGKNCDLQ